MQVTYISESITIANFTNFAFTSYNNSREADGKTFSLLTPIPSASQNTSHSGPINYLKVPKPLSMNANCFPDPAVWEQNGKRLRGSQSSW